MAKAEDVRAEPAGLKTRREVLRKILAGGGGVVGTHFLPDEWVKPVINSIIVPAHAQTTGIIATTTTVPSVIVLFSASDQTVTLTAMVTAMGTVVNVGSVTFQVTDAGNNNIGTAVTVPVVNGVATASYIIPGGTPAGAYTITASYSGG